MDGRDIGTNVLPNAQVKIYLNAGVEERAKRRCGELEDIGAEYDFESVKKQIEENHQRHQDCPKGKGRAGHSQRQTLLIFSVHRIRLPLPFGIFVNTNTLPESRSLDRARAYLRAAHPACCFSRNRTIPPIRMDNRANQSKLFHVIIQTKH